MPLPTSPSRFSPETLTPSFRERSPYVHARWNHAAQTSGLQNPRLRAVGLARHAQLHDGVSRRAIDCLLDRQLQRLSSEPLERQAKDHHRASWQPDETPASQRATSWTGRKR